MPPGSPEEARHAIPSTWHGLEGSPVRRAILRPLEAAHTGSDGGMSQKASDYTVIPLCTNCHTQAPDAYHRLGKSEWERRTGLNCVEVCAELRRRFQASLSSGGFKLSTIRRHSSQE